MKKCNCECDCDTLTQFGMCTDCVSLGHNYADEDMRITQFLMKVKSLNWMGEYDMVNVKILESLIKEFKELLEDTNN